MGPQNVLIAQRDAIDPLGLRGGQAAVLRVVGMGFDQPALTVRDAQDVRVHVVGKTILRAVGVKDLCQPGRTVVGLGGHGSDSILHSGCLRGTIGVAVGKG